MIQETQLLPAHLIMPFFLTSGQGIRQPIPSMPGMYRYSLDLLLPQIQKCLELGIRTICLFPHYPEEKKDRLATESWNEQGLYLSAIRTIKLSLPEITLMTDVAMDPYSSDGHDGLVENGKILNDETLEILGKMALSQAKAGADILGPSDMMDGRVGYLRELLDAHGFTEVSIMSYTAKYASAFYGPFRDALDSAPKFGDKKTYQMDPANLREALLEAQLDFEEGADFMMVKPALPYLDVIRALHEAFDIPIAAYQVSGEYAMIKAAAQNGWLDEKKCMLESLLSIRRAGATAILTYFAMDFAEWYRTNYSY